MDTGSPALRAQKMVVLIPGKRKVFCICLLCIVWCWPAREKWGQFGHHAKNLIREFDAANHVAEWGNLEPGTFESKRVGKADIQKHQSPSMAGLWDETLRHSYESEGRCAFLGFCSL